MGQFGARSFNLSIDTGRGTLLPPAGNALDPDALQQAVSDAGFELLGLELEAQGRLRHVQGDLGQELSVLEIESTSQRFALIRGHSDHERDVWERFQSGFDQDGAALWVRGRIHSHHDGPTALEISDFSFGDCATRDMVNTFVRAHR